jgi:uncharacterized membrane protein
MNDPIVQTIVVKGDIEGVYKLWANFENFPLFMKDIRSVTKVDDKVSHWVMEGPLGAKVEWDAETTRLDENERIAWNSKDNSTLKTSGQVTFKELAPTQTELTVTLQYVPPAGMLGEAVAQLFSNPEKRLTDDLQRFKEHVESTSTRIRDSRASAKLGTLNQTN